MVDNSDRWDYTALKQISQREAMARNLQDMKDGQDDLRERAVRFYITNKYSILRFSKEVGIPYTSLRSFLYGSNISFRSMVKLEEYMDKV